MKKFFPLSHADPPTSLHGRNGIPTFFVSDGGRGAMTGVDLGVIIQGEQFVDDAILQYPQVSAG